MEVTLEQNDKKLVIINICRMPRTPSNGDCFSLTQRNKEDGKVKTTNECKKEMFNKIR